MLRLELIKPEREGHIALWDRVSVFANAALQQIGLESLPFVETYITVSAKLDGIKGIFNRINEKICIHKTLGNDESEIELQNVPLDKLEEVKYWLHKVKIAIYEIKPSYSKLQPRTFTIVVYKGK